MAGVVGLALRASRSARRGSRSSFNRHGPILSTCPGAGPTTLGGAGGASARASRRRSRRARRRARSSCSTASASAAVSPPRGRWCPARPAGSAPPGPRGRPRAPCASAPPSATSSARARLSGTTIRLASAPTAASSGPAVVARQSAQECSTTPEGRAESWVSAADHRRLSRSSCQPSRKTRSCVGAVWSIVCWTRAAGTRATSHPWQRTWVQYSLSRVAERPDPRIRSTDLVEGARPGEQPPAGDPVVRRDRGREPLCGAVRVVPPADVVRWLRGSGVGEQHLTALVDPHRAERTHTGMGVGRVDQRVQPAGLGRPCRPGPRPAAPRR